MSTPVQIPADVDREDTLLGALTARQLIILTVAGALLYAYWALTGPTELPVFAVGAAPVVLAAAVLTFGRRDGVSADRLLIAALRQRAETPTLPRSHRAARTGDDRHGGDSGDGSGELAGREVVARVPARLMRAAGEVGVLDLGRDGLAVVCTVSPVNFTLRSATERDALVAGFARWLHSLSRPVQILSRTSPLDLTGAVEALRRNAPALPHPALTEAAFAHADHLAGLAEHTDLLQREFLLVFREPHPRNGPAAAAPAATGRASRAAVEQLRRRAGEATGLLAGIGLRVTPLGPDAAGRAVHAATNPEHHLHPPQPRPRCRPPRPRAPRGETRPPAPPAHPRPPRGRRSAAPRRGAAGAAWDAPTVELAWPDGAGALESPPVPSPGLHHPARSPVDHPHPPRPGTDAVAPADDLAAADAAPFRQEPAVDDVEIDAHNDALDISAPAEGIDVGGPT